MSDVNATETLQYVMAEAKKRAEARGHEYIGTEHILLAITLTSTAGSAHHLLAELGADPAAIETTVESIMQPTAAPWGTTRHRSGVRPAAVELPITRHAGAALQHAITLATSSSSPAMGTSHILAGLLHETKSPAASVLAAPGAGYDAVVRLLPNSPQ